MRDIEQIGNFSDVVFFILVQDGIGKRNLPEQFNDQYFFRRAQFVIQQTDEVM